MAGLNFYTQTIINKNEDPDSGKKLFIGGANSPEGSGYLKVLRDFIFYKDKAGYGKVVRAVKKLGHKETLCEATINFNGLSLHPSEEEAKAGIKVKNYRLDIYLGVEGAEPFILSNPWVQKGMPFWVEFSLNSKETGALAAAKVEKLIKQNKIFLHDKDLIKVSVSGPTMTLTGTSEYLRFKKIEIVEYAPDSVYETEAASLGSPNIVLTKRGCNGFGTYSQIVKDLRLPTAANWQPSHIRQVETPILNAVYDQYIIDYEAPATNEGLGCVGLRLNSVTTHVFWVNQDIASEFDSAISTSTIKFETSKPEAMETDDVSDDKARTQVVKPSDMVHPEAKKAE